MGNVIEQKSVELDQISRMIVTSAYEQADSITANANMAAAGWGATVKAKMAASSTSKLKAQEVKFVASRKIRFGYTGWHLPPPLSTTSLDILCKNPKTFRDTYGDYYVAGHKMGSSLVIEVTSKTSTTDTSKAISASVSGTWSGFGATAGGGAGFSAALDKSKSLSSSTVVVTMSG
jgi:hypothetical protein